MTTEYTTLIPRHRVELQHALEQEMFNRADHLKFHNVLVFQRFYDDALKQVKNGTVSINILNWCYQQFTNYGAVGKKPHVKSVIEWLPCAIHLPETYQAFPDYKTEYVKPPKQEFDDELGQFLFQAQCFSEFFNLDFSFIYSEYITKRKNLKMYQWLLLKEMFGDNKMRKSIANRLEQPVSIIPKMPQAYASHLSQVDNVVLNESYSSLEIVSKIKRHQMAVVTLALHAVDKKMWYDQKGSLVFNPLPEEKREWMRDILIRVIEDDFELEKSLRGYVNNFLKDLGFKTKILYWV